MRQITYEDFQNIKKPNLSTAITLVLDRLKTPDNIASIFRLADATAVDHLIFYQTNFQPHQIEKQSRSCSKKVEYSLVDEVADITQLAKTTNFVALEWTESSVPLYEYSFPQTVCMVVGNEKNGIDESLIALCNDAVHIPMLGNNSSMNVAMATGMACYEIRRQDILLSSTSKT